MHVDLKDRMVAVVFAMLVTFYIGIVAVFICKNIEDRTFVICSGAIFVVSFSYVHTHFKLKNIEKKLNKRSDRKNGYIRKKNKG
jgi:hypothetical protein